MASPQETTTAWAVFSAIGGSVIGASMGGVINYLLQRATRSATKRQRDDDRREVRKAIGLALVFKLIRLASDLHNLGRAVTESLERARGDGFTGSAFQVVVPIVPLPEPIRFSPEEMGLVLSLSSSVFNKIAALDELHNSTVAIFATYNKKRDDVLSHFGAEMTGRVGTTTITAEQKRWLDPRAVELNQLVEAMIQRTQQDAKEAWDAFNELTALISREFEVKLDFERKAEFQNEAASGQGPELVNLPRGSSVQPN